MNRSTPSPSPAMPGSDGPTSRGHQAFAEAQPRQPRPPRLSQWLKRLSTWFFPGRFARSFQHDLGEVTLICHGFDSTGDFKDAAILLKRFLDATPRRALLDEKWDGRYIHRQTRESYLSLWVETPKEIHLFKSLIPR